GYLRYGGLRWRCPSCVGRGGKLRLARLGRAGKLSLARLGRGTEGDIRRVLRHWFGRRSCERLWRPRALALERCRSQRPRRVEHGAVAGESRLAPPPRAELLDDELLELLPRRCGTASAPSYILDQQAVDP